MRWGGGGGVPQVWALLRGGYPTASGEPGNCDLDPIFSWSIKVCPSFPSPRAQLKLRQELAFKGCLKCSLQPKIYRASAFVTLLKMLTEENQGGRIWGFFFFPF